MHSDSHCHPFSLLSQLCAFPTIFRKASHSFQLCQTWWPDAFFLIPSQVVVDIAEEIITHILCTLLLRESASHVN